MLFALIKLHPEQATAALVLASIGNTLGGMTTYAMARLIPEKFPPPSSAMPCAAAGWLRLPPLACTLWMATGKAARYALVVAGAGMV